MTMPTPDQADMHCVAAFPHRDDALNPLLARTRQRFADFRLPESNWREAKDPLPVRYGPAHANGWDWHFLHSHNPMPELVAGMVRSCRMSPEAAEALTSHQSYLMLFLVESRGLPLPRIRTFCDLAVHLLNLGGSVLAWPEGRVAWHRDELRGLDPSRMEALDFGLIARWNLAAAEGPGAGWLRTFGLGQFDLPEIACPLPGDPDKQREETAHAAKLFEHVPPYLIGRNDWLKVGDWIEVIDQTWDVARWADKTTEPFLLGRFGAMCYVRRGSGSKA